MTALTILILTGIIIAGEVAIKKQKNKFNNVNDKYRRPKK